jgi:hypothetical protein
MVLSGAPSGRHMSGPLPGVLPPADILQPSGLMNTSHLLPRLFLAVTILPFYQKGAVILSSPLPQTAKEGIIASVWVRCGTTHSCGSRD